MHIVSLRAIEPAHWERILARAQEHAAAPQATLTGRVICMAFHEPSTRTRLSFETAAHRLGAKVIGFAGAGGISAMKGESLEDEIRVLAGYADAIVLRHPEMGSAALATLVSDVPIINAGDGAGEHPTQTLLDLFQMGKIGPIADLHVAVVGDLKHGRTVHSLVPALRTIGAKVTQVAPPGLELPEEYARLERMTLVEAAKVADVLYVTRLQKERLDDETFDPALWRVDANLLKATSSRAIVMHPLPRQEELAGDVDALSAAKYFEQAHGGVPVRMAVLEYALGVLP